MTEPITQAAAFHGLATNRAYPVEERLANAITALELYEAEVERTCAVVEAARVYAAKYGPILGNDERSRLVAAVDAMDGSP